MDMAKLVRVHSKLTIKQRQVLVNLDQLGPLYVSFRDRDTKTFQALCKKGLVKIIKEHNGLGAEYAIIKHECAPSFAALFESKTIA